MFWSNTYSGWFILMLSMKVNCICTLGAIIWSWIHYVQPAISEHESTTKIAAATFKISDISSSLHLQNLNVTFSGNSLPLFKSESHKLKISCNSNGSGKAHTDILLMNQSLLRGPEELCLFVTFTPFPVQDMPPKHWPQSDCLLQPLLQRIIQQWISNGGGGGGVCFPTEVKAKVRIRFASCVLWKEVIYSPPYRDPATWGHAGRHHRRRLHATSESCFSVAGATGTIPGPLARLSAGLNHTSFRLREFFFFSSSTVK